MNKPKCFYYITHKDNLKSLLKQGIWCRSQMHGSWWPFNRKPKSIHSEEVVKRREERKFKNRSLWDYANVYFEARNPMLFSVIKKFEASNIAVLQIQSDIIDGPDVGLADGNAASHNTKLFEDIGEGLNTLKGEQFKKTYWNDTDDGKRKIMAEILVYHHIPKEKIMSVYVAHQQAAEEMKNTLYTINPSVKTVKCIPNPNMFFLPDKEKNISQNISLKQGDMFFSEMKVFTISVNTVGIMGKGLASRAKYQFPDVYVLYQDLCRQKKLKMGVPFLHKREVNFIKTLMEDNEILAEDNEALTTENGERWFLLFPTKVHWKYKSPLKGIEEGMQWLLRNYKALGIPSLALPALGCGLGGLDWRDVGPLMCRYLNQMDIPSCIYLPLEKPLPEEHLNPEFLLKQK